MSKAFSKSTKAICTFLFTVKLFSTMFCKHKIASHVPLFFQKPNWSFARFSSIIFSVRPKMIFVKILDVCVKIIQVQYSSHFVNLLFFGNITIILFLKLSGVFPVVYMFLSGIFPVVYMLLIRQYKVYLVLHQILAVTLLVYYLLHMLFFFFFFQFI